MSRPFLAALQVQTRDRRELVHLTRFDRFSTLARRDERLAIYLYHIPQFTYVPISLGLIERLFARYRQVVAGVRDSSGDRNNSKAMIDQFACDGFDLFLASESLLSDVLVLDDEDDAPQPPRDLDLRQQRVARLAVLDPDDGIAL